MTDLYYNMAVLTLHYIGHCDIMRLCKIMIFFVCNFKTLPHGGGAGKVYTITSLTVLLDCLSTILKREPGVSKHYTQSAQPHTQSAEHLRSFAK